MPTILVVDDEDDLRSLLQTMLTDAGYEVVATGDPTQAAELARRCSPALVVSDIAMPVMDGYDVVRALQSDPETAACPVAFLTARRQFTEKVRAFRFGIVDYIAKPFTHGTLTRRVQGILDSLEKRSGAVAGEPSAALLEQAQFEGRSGVLTRPGGASSLLLAAGQVVHTTRAGPPAGDEPGAFRELDPKLDHVVTTAATAPGGEESGPELSEPLRTALVVDDDAAFRLLLKRLLEKIGFKVYEAGDGAEALGIALEQVPWLILTEVRMPGMDGLELCRQLREHSLLSHTPLVFLSAWDDYRERFRSFERHARGGRGPLRRAGADRKSGRAADVQRRQGERNAHHALRGPHDRLALPRRGDRRRRKPQPSRRGGRVRDARMDSGALRVPAGESRGGRAPRHELHAAVARGLPAAGRAGQDLRVGE